MECELGTISNSTSEYRIATSPTHEWSVRVGMQARTTWDPQSYGEEFGE